MRALLYIFILGLVSGCVLYYLGEFVLLPYTEDGLLNLTSVGVMLGLLGVSISSVAACIHGLVEKWAFRKFYQEPRITVALRRGVEVGVLVIFLLYLDIFGFATVQNAFLTLTAIVLVELLVMNIFTMLNPPTDMEGSSKKIKKESI